MNDAEQFQDLLRQHRGILYKVCQGYCRNPDDREDLAQEIVIQLWRSFIRFDPAQSFSTWMYRIALNVAISFYRREARRVSHVVADEEKIFAAADEGGKQTDELRELYELIGQLNELDKALVLLYLDGYTHKEIAGTLGITATNVSTKLNRLFTRSKT